MITPSTTIRFLKVPFSPSQNNVLKFSSHQAQENYMTAKIKFTVSGCTYQREGNGEFIRVGKSMDSLYNCNYVMFQNSNFGSKWFYAFIDRMEFVNSSVTKIFIKMDTYQTFLFDYSLEKSFIDRQTFSNDYYNTLSDTPSTGDLKVSYEHSEPLNGTYIILFNSDPTVDDSSATTNFYYPKIGLYVLPCYMIQCETEDELGEIIQAVSNKGRADRIQACYYAPFIGNDSITSTGILPKGDLKITSDLKAITQVSAINLRKTITVPIDYQFKFKKELSYPYAKLEIVDRITGQSIELDLSKFSDPLNPSFYIVGSLSEIPEYKIIPLSYNGVYYGIENALCIKPSSELPVFSNSYAKYLKDNKTANLINGGISGASAIGSILTGNVAGAVGSFANIAQIVNADNVAQSQPNQVRGINGDASEYLNYSPCIYFRLKTMDSNHIEIARNFWNAYGYPVRRISTFSNTDDKFNFIKTVECNIVAESIPTEYLIDLENIYNKGLTIWNRDYLNYSIL